MDADFTAAKVYAEMVIQEALTKTDKNFCLNVNIPDLNLDLIKGIKKCRQAHAKWQEEFDKRQDPSGQDYYWLTGHFVPFEEHHEEQILWALDNGYVFHCYLFRMTSPTMKSLIV